jgi:hypothetical protein
MHLGISIAAMAEIQMDACFTLYLLSLPSMLSSPFLI